MSCYFRCAVALIPLVALSACSQSDTPDEPADASVPARLEADAAGLSLEASDAGVAIQAGDGTAAIGLRTLHAGGATFSGPWRTGVEGVWRGSDGVAELWDITKLGLRQSWYFEKAPDLGHDLVVEIGIDDGVASTWDSGDSVVIVSSNPELPALRYSNALWIGSDGDSTPLGIGHFGNRIVLTVPADVLARTTFPAWLDPTVSVASNPEPLGLVPDIGDARRLSIACGTNDCAAGFAMAGERGSRVTDDGQLLTPLPDAVQDADAHGDVARLNDTYLHVYRVGGEVRGQRVSPAGALLGSPIVIGTGGSPRVAASSTQFLVVWSGGWRRVAEDGTLLGSVQAWGPIGLRDLDVASDGTTFAIGYSAPGTNILCSGYDYFTGIRMVDANGLAAGGALVESLCFYQAPSPKLSFDGTSYVVAWHKENNENVVQRLGSNGAFQGAGPELVSTGSSDLDIACGPGECFVGWAGGGVTGRAILNGSPVGAPVQVVAGSGLSKVAIARAGANYHLVWSEYDSCCTGGKIWWTPFTLTGVAQYPSGVLLTNVPKPLQHPVAAATMTGNLMAYFSSSPSNECKTVTVDASGVPSAPLVATTQCASVQALAQGTSSYLMAVIDSANIGRVIPLDASGATIGAAVSIGSSSEVDATSLGANFLTVRQSGATITLQRVSPTGSLVGSASTLTGYGARVASTATGALLTYASGSSVRTLSVDTAGTLGTETVLGTGQSPDVAWGTSLGAVAWQSGGIVYVQRVNGSGQPIDAFATSVATSNANPTIEWDGGGFVIGFGASARRYRENGTVDGASFTLPFTLRRGAVAPSSTSNRLFAVGTKTIQTQPRVQFAYIESDAQDGSTCSQNAQCQSGFCVDGVCCASSCGGGVQDCQACSIAAGASSDGACDLVSGIPCSDGSSCTIDDTCQAGICSGSAVVCAPLDVCHGAGVCNPITGACSNPVLADGTSCNDADGCTQTDGCVAGVCVGANPVTCQPADQCNSVAACDPSSGTCPVTPLANGTACNDNDACTQIDACQFGACAGSSPVVCVEDACHFAGVCDPASGVCSTPSKPDGTICDDADPCTESDVCTAGACSGTPVICAAPDECHDPGGCDSATGLCVPMPKPDGTECADADLCTDGDTCQAGICSTGSPIICPPAADCQVLEACDPGTGTCPTTDAVDGTACGGLCKPGGTCSGGVCGGGIPVECVPLDDCHVAGTCDDLTGECDNPVAANGTACRTPDGPGVCQAGNCESDGSASSGGGGSSASAGGSSGDGGGSASGGGGSPSDGDSAPQEDGCSCVTAGGPQPAGSSAIPLAVLALLLIARRRNQPPSGLAKTPG